MKPAPFHYHRPPDLDEALRLLRELGPQAKVLAGGQSLVPILNMRLATPAHIVDINALGGAEGLDRVRVSDDAVQVGALVRHAQLLADEQALAALPLLGQALEWVAHPVIRNRGTTVGSLMHADPSAEMPAVLALTGGSVTLRTAEGERDVPAAQLFTGPMECAAQPEEIAVSATFPRFPAGTRTGCTQIARRHGDYALAGVLLAAQVTDSRLGRVRASFVSLTPTPDVLDLTESVAGVEVTEVASVMDAVGAAVADHVDPDGDIHASAEYRRHLAVVQTRRLLTHLLDTSDREPVEVRA